MVEGDADGKRPRERTFNALSSEEQVLYKNAFLEAHSELLNRYIGAERLRAEILPNWPSRKKHTRSLDGTDDEKQYMSLVRRLLSLIRSYCLLPEKSGRRMLKKLPSMFAFDPKRPPHVDCDLECLMRVISSMDLSPYPELFRQSASFREVTELHTHLMEIKESSIMQISPESTERDTEEADMQSKAERDCELVCVLTGTFREFEINVISSVFKIVLKEETPLFPSEFISLYMDIGKGESQEEKVALSQFVVAFLVGAEGRDLLEAVSEFLNDLVTREGSRLRFRNLAVVFVPVFFIDGNFRAGSNFKEPVEKLRVFLEFFLENCKSIFLLTI